MRPRGDSVCTILVLRATAWNRELLFGAHLQEPQAREESDEQGDDDDADDRYPDAAVVGHA